MIELNKVGAHEFKNEKKNWHTGTFTPIFGSDANGVASITPDFPADLCGSGSGFAL
jgi:hypothetical protein